MLDEAAGVGAGVGAAAARGAQRAELGARELADLRRERASASSPRLGGMSSPTGTITSG